MVQLQFCDNWLYARFGRAIIRQTLNFSMNTVRDIVQTHYLRLESLFFCPALASHRRLPLLLLLLLLSLRQRSVRLPNPKWAGQHVSKRSQIARLKITAAIKATPFSPCSGDGHRGGTYGFTRLKLVAPRWPLLLACSMCPKWRGHYESHVRAWCSQSARRCPLPRSAATWSEITL